MSIGYGLNIEQTQKLIMTPELRQAITVLQLSALELAQYIEQQLLENPFLEVKEEGTAPEDDAAADIPAGVEDSAPKDDQDWEEFFYEPFDRDFSRVDHAEPREYGYENYLTKAPTLSEHLVSQLELSSAGGEVKTIGEYLIGNLDEQGYLRCTVEEVTGRLGVSEKDVEKALGLLQSFDPPGIGARNLKECLLNQVEQLGLDNGPVRGLIENHLEDLARGKLNRIARDLGIDVTEVQRAADLLRTLDPKPGRNFSSSTETRYIVPDILLEKVDDEYVILINDAGIPRIGINGTYRLMLEQQKDAQTKRYMETRLNAAAWLIRSIEQRKITLYRVTGCLVELQRDFLDRGVKYLKPLNLKKVAERLGLHESTVSRATAGKYIQAPHGVYEMKYFFSTGLKNSNGTSTSAESIKCTLGEFIAAEDAKNPLNDQQLVELCRQRGIRISRRTVAKYRDEMGIASANRRKRY